ncbi:MAG TPA: hypothetical protein VEI01_19965 [Terriglobales bacterium]|nr:hypothetical protein [Terriglobales bacterium]
MRCIAVGILLVVAFSLAEEPRVIDTVKLGSSQTVDLKDGKGSVKLISMMGRSARYVLKGNEGEQNPEISEEYFLVPAPARVYECENVAMIPRYKSPPGPSHYRGVYCLVGTYPKD